MLWIWPVVTVAVIGVVLLLVTSADAAPLVPPSDQPGRERYRFEPSPLDLQFMADELKAWGDVVRSAGTKLE